MDRRSFFAKATVWTLGLFGVSGAVKPRKPERRWIRMRDLHVDKGAVERYEDTRSRDRQRFNVRFEDGPPWVPDQVEDTA